MPRALRLPAAAAFVLALAASLLLIDRSAPSDPEARDQGSGGRPAEARRAGLHPPPPPGVVGRADATAGLEGEPEAADRGEAPLDLTLRLDPRPAGVPVVFGLPLQSQRVEFDGDIAPEWYTQQPMLAVSLSRRGDGPPFPRRP